MVNEEKVKEFFQMAVYDKHEEARYRQMGEYYKSDYIGKELVRSVFTGTLAFVFIGALYLMGSVETLLDGLNNMAWVQSLVHVLLLYLCFMALYLLVTYVVYWLRYRTGRAKLKKYYTHLKRVNRAYEKESKPKV
jgi:type III secretory pathway component EscU